MELEEVVELEEDEESEELDELEVDALEDALVLDLLSVR